MKDLDAGILYLSRAVSLRSPAYDDTGNSFDDARWTWLMNLGAAMRTRYNRLGEMVDLHNVIKQLEEAVSICPVQEPRRPRLLNNLGRSLRSTYDRTNDSLALDRAISLFREALDRRPAADPERVTSLQDLANALNARYKLGGRRAELDEAIRHHREALELRPADHPDLWIVQSNLGNTLSARSQVSGDIRELDEAIRMQREAVKNCPETHRDRANPLLNLASSLRLRLVSQPSDQSHLEDLNEPIALNKEALRLRPVGHPDRSSPLDNLANTLASKYDHSGDIRDLDQAIQYYREALALRPKGPARALTLNNLGLILHSRYRETRNINDLEESIRMHRGALELRPRGHSDHWMSLSHLGTALESCVDSNGMYTRIDEAMNCHRQALERCPDSFVVRAHVVDNLAGAALTRYEKLHIAEDLEESIKCYEEALAIYGSGHPWRAIALYNVAQVREMRFRKGHDAHDLNEVIRRGEESKELLPADHPQQCKVLWLLARAYLYGDVRAHDAFILLEKAAILKTGAIQDRLSVAVDWANAARRWNHTSVIKAYTLALELLDRRLLSQPTAEMQHELLVQMPRTLASDACSAAIELGQLDTAVELLEQGRCLLWARMTSYRHPMDKLRVKNSELAREFELASKELETLATPSSRTFGMDDANSVFEQQLKRLHKSSHRWDRVVDEIRQLEGFSNFLRAAPFAELRRAAMEGPIIIVNISTYRSDAIIVDATQPTLAIALPDATPESLLTLSSTFTSSLGELHSEGAADQNERMPSTQDSNHSPSLRKHSPSPIVRYHWKQIRGSLRSLWKQVVQPITEGLCRTIAHGMIGRLPRVWWYPTGALCRLPLHAAGPSSTGDKKTHFCDLYISSYVTTFGSMLQARSRSDGDGSGATVPKMLVIGVPGEHEDIDFLDNVAQEISIIQDRTSKSSSSPPIQVLVGEHATPEGVLSRLQEHSWVHFVCHGHQHPSPFDSSFQLFNNQHISLIDLMQAHIPDGQLAYLSACNTATGDFDKTPDEFIHLAAAMQFCGFRSVIGTLWPMRDEDGPTATDRFYAHMFRQEGTTKFTDSAEALHETAAVLRQRGVPIDCWINFVHFGI